MARNPAASSSSPNLLLCLFWISLSSVISGAARLSVEKEQKALLDVRTGIFSVGHGELSSWSGGDDCSRWERVQCHNITSHVVKLDLSGLGGSTPIKSEVISSLLDLEHLTYLDLSRNNFDGAAIPAFLGSLTRLEHLDLSRGGFSGRIPHQLGNLSKLLHLNLSYNSISGRIPESIGNLKNLNVLILSFNSIEGVVPRSFRNFSKMSILDLSNNRISGQIPNSFSEPIPKSSAAGDSGLRFLLLAKNRFSGKIPPTLICIASLEIVNLSNNSLSGALPDCWRNSSHLMVMDVSSNKLSGCIPTALGLLTKLRSLHLNNNNFTGRIPLILQGWQLLLIMDLSFNELSHEIPSWNGGSLMSLRVLSLRSNKLSGEIPWQLSSIHSLQVLDLAHNNLSGTLPPAFGSLSSMVAGRSSLELVLHELGFPYYTFSATIFVENSQFTFSKILSLVTSIDLSNNNLSGEIPEDMTNLYGLVFFNLSWNHFSGNIPYEIGLMGRLESFDLSGNHLSGGIPSSISSLYYLDRLNLSHNNFVGRIPTGNQMQTFTNLSYMGNPKLCGDPLQIKCPGDNSTIDYGATEEENMQEDDEYGRIWYFIGFALGFVFGIWGFMGAVMIKKSTRIKYILMIDRIYSWLMHM